MEREQDQDLEGFLTSLVSSVIESAVAEYEQLNRERELKRQNKEYRKIWRPLEGCQSRTSKLLKKMNLKNTRDTTTRIEDAPYLRPNNVTLQRCALQPSLQKTNLYVQQTGAPTFNITQGHILTYTADSSGMYCHFYQDNYLDSNKACEATNVGNKYITDYIDGKYHVRGSEEHCNLQISAKPITEQKPKSIMERLVKFFTFCISRKNKD